MENSNIGCSVNECRHHSPDKNYCTLQQVQIGKTQTTSTTSKDTDCESFEVK